jgi:hypothetical protein
MNYVLGGVFSEDYANIFLRSSWSLNSEKLYHGPGGWDYKRNGPASPEVRWLDNTHLLILNPPTALLHDHVGNVWIVSAL